MLPTECQIIKVQLYTECYLLPTECQIIKVPLYTECYLLPTECQIIRVPLYTECYVLPVKCQIIKVESGQILHVMLLGNCPAKILQFAPEGRQSSSPQRRLVYVHVYMHMHSHMLKAVSSDWEGVMAHHMLAVSCRPSSIDALSGIFGLQSRPISLVVLYCPHAHSSTQECSCMRTLQQCSPLFADKDPGM